VIRPVTAVELPELVRVHCATLPGSLPTLFGDAFHRHYYQALLLDQDFFCDGFFYNGRMAGFLNYTTDSRRLFVHALRRRFLALGWAAAAGVLARPARLKTLLSVLPLARGAGTGTGDDVGAELLSFGVLPEFRRSSEWFRRQRRHVARELLDRAVDVLRQRDATLVKIFIQPEDVNPFVNRFYQEAGFRLMRATERFGIRANFYLKNLLE
jgi:ribosomal protein S18 acetylase RimI-like enzyme